jgi:formylglycine-generating enzyme required for sulfatase activity
MVVVPGPVVFTMGSPPSEPDRIATSEETRLIRIDRTFAIAAKEVTVEQYQRFARERGVKSDYSRTIAPEPDCPQVWVNWYQAAAYCNWLSEKDEIPPEQWCYEPDPKDGFAPGMRLPPGYLGRTGYRLPSEAEWECACRAGTVVGRYFGSDVELLPRYA